MTAITIRKVYAERRIFSDEQHFSGDKERGRVKVRREKCGVHRTGFIFGIDGTNGIDRINRKDREDKEFREILSLNFLNSLNSLIYHLNQRTNFLSEGCRVLHSAKMPPMGST